MRIRVFTTCPQTKDVAAADYAEHVAAIARWSEEAGCHGILVYTDNGIGDPWLVAQLIIQSTQALSPLVAVQPVYMTPYAAAKMVATLGYLHGAGSTSTWSPVDFARTSSHSVTTPLTTIGTCASSSTPRWFGAF